LSYPRFSAFIRGSFLLMARLVQKIALVTGSSRGIGAAISSAFLGEGAKVIGIARTASELSAENYTPVEFDLARAAVSDMRELIIDLTGKFGRIDILVNNAGIIRRGPAVDFSETDFDDVLRLNLKVPFFLTQAVARWWLESGIKESPDARLKVINIASLLSFQGGILVPSYTASKHGIAGITKALANEWAAHRINVNAIAPGYVETENTRALRDDAARNQAILSRIPQGHWAAPQTIAGGCVFLASSDSDYVNGAILNIDGGWLAR
jgi:2-deoxy-D-gluconate 3-dehydrogenase